MSFRIFQFGGVAADMPRKGLYKNRRYLEFSSECDENSLVSAAFFDKRKRVRARHIRRRTAELKNMET